MISRISLTILSAFILAMTVLPASAHEFILVPQAWESYTSGQELPFSLASSHVFMKSEELENPANVKADYMGKDIPVTADEAFKTYTGV